MNNFLVCLILFFLSSCVSPNHVPQHHAKEIYQLITYKQYLEPARIPKYFNLNESDYRVSINNSEGKTIYKSQASSNIELIEITVKRNNRDIYQEIKVGFSNEACISPEELEGYFWNDIRVATYDPIHILALAPKNDDVKMVGRGKRFTISPESGFKGMVSFFENGCQNHVLINRNIYKN